MKHDPGKEPQALQAENEALRREIGDLKSRLNRADRKNLDLWKRISKLERQQSTDIQKAEVPHGI